MVNLDDVTVTLDESQRQAVLMALAHLAVERPGWDMMLNEIALKMDNLKGDRAEMFDSFVRMHELDITAKQRAGSL